MGEISDCAQRSLERDKVVPLFERLSRIEALDTISDLMRLLERRAPARCTSQGGV